VRVGHLNIRAKAEAPSARRADTPTLVGLLDVADADWRKCDTCGVWRTEARRILLSE
jgi:hypothetical protein